MVHWYFQPLQLSLSPRASVFHWLYQGLSGAYCYNPVNFCCTLVTPCMYYLVIGFADIRILKLCSYQLIQHCNEAKQICLRFFLAFWFPLAVSCWALLKGKPAVSLLYLWHASLYYKNPLLPDEQIQVAIILLLDY